MACESIFEWLLEVSSLRCDSNFSFGHDGIHSFLPYLYASIATAPTALHNNNVALLPQQPSRTQHLQGLRIRLHLLSCAKQSLELDIRAIIQRSLNVTSEKIVVVLDCATLDFKVRCTIFRFYIAKPTSFPLLTHIYDLIRYHTKHVSMLGKGLPAKTEVVGGKSQATYVQTGTLSEAQPLATIRVSTTKEGSAPLKGATLPLKTESKSTTHSPTQSRHHSLSPAGHTAETEQTISADISVKMEPGQPLKLARTSSQKVMTRPTRLFDNLADMTADAKNTFQVISQCIYAAKYLGTTEHAMECDCAEEWSKTS